MRKKIQGQKESQIYFLFTSLMMLFPPLSYGLTMIYFGGSYNISSVALIMNYSLILIMGVVALLLIFLKIISIPTFRNVRSLIYGLLSNGVIFLFVLQNQLKIAEYIDIYMSTFAILMFYLVLITYKNFKYELLILSLVYLGFYRFHMYYVFATPIHTPPYIIKPLIDEVTVGLRLLYVSIPLLTIGVYGLKIYKYKILDGFTKVYIILSVLTLFVYFDLGIEKYLATVYLIMPFVMIIDFIVSKINRNFNPLKIPFYIRINTLVIFLFILRMTQYFTTMTYQREQMFMYTFMMYLTIIVVVIEHFIHAKHNKEQISESITTSQKTIIYKISQADLLTIVTEYLARENKLKSFHSKTILLGEPNKDLRTVVVLSNEQDLETYDLNELDQTIDYNR